MQWSYPEVTAPADRGRIVARRPMARLACYWPAMAAVLFALQSLLGLFAPVLGRTSGRMGRISCFSSRRAVFHPRLSLAEAKSPVAAAEPPDRHLRVHRSDSGGAAGRDGDHHALRSGRTVCGLRRHLRNSTRSYGVWRQQTPLSATNWQRVWSAETIRRRNRWRA